MLQGDVTIGFILGDQLDPGYPAWLGLRKGADVLLMVEAAGESRHVASHVQRTVLFLSAMRHHAAALRKAGWRRLDYVELDDPDNTGTLAGELRRAIERHGATRVAVIDPGEHRVLADIERACNEAGVRLRVGRDAHFLCDDATFAQWAEGRRELTMEYFYREQRRTHGVLMTEDGKPVGGEWNLDKQNRKAFKSQPDAPPPPAFEPDAMTNDVIELVRRELPDLPGTIGSFAWPVTREQAYESLVSFIEQRLPSFGDYQDAMWTGQDTLYHSLLSPMLNLKLLDPRTVIKLAVDAYESGAAPLNAAEGFVRQILGWREFIRGVYRLKGPGYLGANALGHHGGLPEFYWTGQTDMTCMREALRSVHDRAYGHHIARLMVTGNFALIAGIDPKQVNDWYLGMYADAVDWVTAPNTLGMALHADGGVVGTKPYAASGKYIKRMSNYCKGCAYDVESRHGDGACPFNVLYWDFLIRHRDRFESNRRMAMIMKNVDRLADQELTQITVSADSLRERLGVGAITLS